MDLLKLIALDAGDLEIVSVHVQDAVMKSGDLQYLPPTKSFVMPMNRFAWEAGAGGWRPHNERRNAVLHFDRVLNVRSTGIDRSKKQDVLSLLAVRFEQGEEPAGVVELVFAGEGVVRLDVECVEAKLSDLGGAWQAASRPNHKA